MKKIITSYIILLFFVFVEQFIINQIFNNEFFLSLLTMILVELFSILLMRKIFEFRCEVNLKINIFVIFQCILLLLFFIKKYDFIEVIYKLSYELLLVSFFEELIFRRIYLDKLNERFSLIQSIFISSILFAFMHITRYIYINISFEKMIASLFIVTLIGILLCFADVLSNNFLVIVLLHTVNNTLNTNMFLLSILLLIIYMFFKDIYYEYKKRI